MDAVKKLNESLMDYQIRLYRNKKALGLSNREIGDLLNKEYGTDWDESKFRKEADAWISGIDYAIRNSLDDEVIEMYDAKIDELYKQQVKTRDALREKRSGLRSEGRLELLNDTMAEIGRSMQTEYPFDLDVEVKKVKENKVAVLTLSDLHYGQSYDNFTGKYNVEILIHRIAQVINATIEECKLRDVRDLKIINLGDCINGIIHVSTRIESEEDAISQIMHVSELLSHMIERLAPHFNSIEYHDTLDNHSRISPNKKLSMESENLGRLISFYLKPRLSGLKNVKVNDDRLDETVSKINILGETALAVHGHLDKPGTVITKLSSFLKIFPIAVFMGHYHHSMSDDVQGMEMLVNGSFSGTDTFAKEMRLTSIPLQRLHFYTKVNNKVVRESERRIILS